MSERHQALIRTRCPSCKTTFRVTSAQLRIRLGKVRCGQCLTVFNAFDTLITDDDQDGTPLPAAYDEYPEAPPVDDIVPEPPVSEVPVSAEPEQGAGSEVAPEVEPDSETEPELESRPEQVSEPVTVLEEIESIEESLTAAREAGLMAARELNETPAYNRWADGALANNSLGAFSSEPARPARWPYVLVALPLFMALLVQLLLYYRTELVQRVPAISAFYQALAVDVPLPSNSELVSIESSDLQADAAQGLLILQAVLRNRASYDQAWPLLELSLTNTQDAVIARRVLTVDDYLPALAQPRAFSANAEYQVRLKIDAKEVGAAGYRLYVFYP